jgi:hypothetical protein
MAIKFKVLAAATVLTLAGGIGTAVSGSAHASGVQWCNNSSGSECLDAWFGGPAVETYPAGNYANGNNEWSVTSLGIPPPCGGYHTTSSCPWPGTTPGLPIVQFNSASTGSCGGEFIGDSGNSQTDAAAGCVGYGGWGWNFIEDAAGCPAGAARFISIHWSTSWSSARGLQVGGSTGDKVYNNSTPACLYNQ